MRHTFALLLMAATLPVWAAQPVRARHGMVVSRERHATAVGIQVLKNGGNAIDAAAAVGLALAVTHPSAGNIGGGGFMLIRLADGRTTFIDFRERAPLSASRNMYLDAAGKATQVVNVLDFGMNVQEAVAWPRFHHQWMPDVLSMETAATW
jgi:gamma-glutamyltranspeptidase/glutathione hydrolase